MTRSTKSYIVRKLSSVFSVYIRPLDFFRSIINDTTIRTLNRLSLFSPNPLVKTPIAHRFALPSIILRTSSFFRKSRYSFSFKIRTSNTTYSSFKSRLYKFLDSCFRVAFSRAKVSFFNFRGRPKKNRVASQTFCFNHNIIIASI